MGCCGKRNAVRRLIATILKSKTIQVEHNGVEGELGTLLCLTESEMGAVMKNRAPVKI